MKSVAFLIEVMIEDYRKDSGRNPIGIVVGPTEYRNLCQETAHSRDFLKDAAVNGAPVTDYKGFPLFVKELPGIDLLINYKEAFSAAYR